MIVTPGEVTLLQCRHQPARQRPHLPALLRREPHLQRRRSAGAILRGGRDPALWLSAADARDYCDGGADLAASLRESRRRGLFTSLDMALPDPASEAGQVDWRALLQTVLPFVDAFLPSIEETLFMLDRARYDELRAQYGVAG